MTTTLTPQTKPAASGATDATAQLPRKWKIPIILGIGALIAIFVFALGAPADQNTGVNFVGDAAADVSLPTRVTNLILGVIMLAIAGIVTYLAWQRKHISPWFAAVFGFLWAIALILWIGTGANVPLTWFLTSTISLATPLVFGSMAGLVSERSGVVNIAIEGQLLAGAFTGALVSSLTQNAYIGLIAAMVAGALVSLILAVFSIKYWVEQVVVGVVINMIVIGITNYFSSGLMSANRAVFNSPVKYDRWNIPVLADIPVIGPLLFQHTLITYVMILLVPILTFAIFRTKWGLRTRAVGEHPKAADTVGIKVNRTRFMNVLLSGVIAGAGGTFFTLGQVGAFTPEVTSGQGYIALAALIFGRWHPLYASAAALLFGFANSAAALAGQVGARVPSEVMLMIPYIVTVLAVVGFVGKSRAPAADGVPYIKA